MSYIEHLTTSTLFLCSITGTLEPDEFDYTFIKVGSRSRSQS